VRASLFLIGSLVIATLYLGLESASARRSHVGAWCARVNTGANRVQENCTFDSAEACRRSVISGNRGFCSRNPAYKKRQSSGR
jgi:uncharacterized protein DUF3551